MIMDNRILWMNLGSTVPSSISFLFCLFFKMSISANAFFFIKKKKKAKSTSNQEIAKIHASPPNGQTGISNNPSYLKNSHSLRSLVREHIILKRLCHMRRTSYFSLCSFKSNLALCQAIVTVCSENIIQPLCQFSFKEPGFVILKKGIH